MKRCSKPNCPKKHYAHGLCHAHYMKKRRAARDETGRTEASRRYQEERWRFLDAFKQVAGCSDCGTAAGTLDFDHRDPLTKSFILGVTSRNWVAIRDEIAKCDVRCRSCHSRRHMVEGHAERMSARRWAACL